MTVTYDQARALAEEWIHLSECIVEETAAAKAVQRTEVFDRDDSSYAQLLAQRKELEQCMGANLIQMARELQGFWTHWAEICAEEDESQEDSEIMKDAFWRIWNRRLNEALDLIPGPPLEIKPAMIEAEWEGNDDTDIPF